MNPYIPIVRYAFIPVSVMLAANALADDSHKPLPRPELLPLSAQHLQQIQGLGQAVIIARRSQPPDTRGAALRGALLDIRAEIGTLVAAPGSPQKLASVPCASDRCPQDGLAQAKPINMAGIQARRQTLFSAIADAEGDPKLAPMTNKARELGLEVDAATQAPQEDQTAKLGALYRKLEPRATMQPEQTQGRASKSVLATRHTFAHHKPGVRRDGQ